MVVAVAVAVAAAAVVAVVVAAVVAAVVVAVVAVAVAAVVASVFHLVVYCNPFWHLSLHQQIYNFGSAVFRSYKLPLNAFATQFVASFYNIVKYII